MTCPFCAHREDKVIDSRSSKEGSTIRRRRECLGCGFRFTTYEEIEHQGLMVIKRDSRREEFSREKLLHGIQRACEKRPVSVAAIDAVALVPEDAPSHVGPRRGGVRQRPHDAVEARLHRLARIAALPGEAARLAAAVRALPPEMALYKSLGRFRDALLAVSGKLENSMGGSLLPTNNRAYVTGTANFFPQIYDSNRRSVYLPVVRSALYEVYQVFDFAEPSVLNGKRDTTTLATQALFMLNSEVVNRSSAELARQLVADESLNDSQRIRDLYLRAFGREPTDADQSRPMLRRNSP